MHKSLNTAWYFRTQKTKMWIDLVENSGWLWTVVNTVMNLQVALKPGSSLTIRATGAFEGLCSVEI
jgi:hypothetical protein